MDNERLKLDIANAHQQKMEFERQIRHKNTVIYRLKQCIDHQKKIIKGLQEANKQLMAEIGK